jgi:hypothetical protein
MMPGRESAVVAAFLSFWFFFFLCEWLWKCGKVRESAQALVTNRHPNHSDGYPQTFDQGQVWKQMHTQMASFEDSTIRAAIFQARLARNSWRKEG